MKKTFCVPSRTCITSGTFLMFPRWCAVEQYNASHGYELQGGRTTTIDVVRLRTRSPMSSSDDATPWSTNTDAERTKWVCRPYLLIYCLPYRMAQNQSLEFCPYLRQMLSRSMFKILSPAINYWLFGHHHRVGHFGGRTTGAGGSPRPLESAVNTAYSSTSTRPR